MGEKKRGQKVNWGGYAKGRGARGGISSMHAKKSNKWTFKQTQTDRDRQTYRQTHKKRGKEEASKKLMQSC